MALWGKGGARKRADVFVKKRSIANFAPTWVTGFEDGGRQPYIFIKTEKVLTKAGFKSNSRPRPFLADSKYIIRKRKNASQKAERFLLVGVTGFEPATFYSRSKRATKLRYTPIYMLAGASVIGANERIRTADLLITNEPLCQLSYIGAFYCFAQKVIITQFFESANIFLRIPFIF